MSKSDIENQTPCEGNDGEAQKPRNLSRLDHIYKRRHSPIQQRLKDLKTTERNRRIDKKINDLRMCNKPQAASPDDNGNLIPDNKKLLNHAKSGVSLERNLKASPVRREKDAFSKEGKNLSKKPDLLKISQITCGKIDSTEIVPRESEPSQHDSKFSA